MNNINMHKTNEKVTIQISEVSQVPELIRQLTNNIQCINSPAKSMKILIKANKCVKEKEWRAVYGVRKLILFQCMSCSKTRTYKKVIWQVELLS